MTMGLLGDDGDGDIRRPYSIESILLRSILRRNRWNSSFMTMRCPQRQRLIVEECLRLVAAHPMIKLQSLALGNPKTNVETPRLPSPSRPTQRIKCKWKIPNLLSWRFPSRAIIFSLLKRETGGCQEKLVCEIHTYQLVAHRDVFAFVRHGIRV